MTTIDGYVKGEQIVLDLDLSVQDGKKVLITFYDEGENPYEIKKPIPVKIENMLHDFVIQTVAHFGTHVQKIILYGSYARGDYRDCSDLDIMVLVDYSKEEIKKYRSDLSDLSFDIGDKYDLIIISPIMQNIRHFKKWLDCSPFYSNVVKEGVELYVK